MSNSTWTLGINCSCFVYLPTLKHPFMNTKKIHVAKIVNIKENLSILFNI